MALAKLSAALDKLKELPIFSYVEILETLGVYVENLVTFAEEERYRRILLDNVHFYERVGRYQSALDALAIIGFVQQGDYLVFDESKGEVASEQVQQQLKEFQALLNDRFEAVRKEIDEMPLRLPAAHLYKAVQGAGGACDIGHRKTMEDEEILVDSFCGDETKAYFGLYDGHGGRQTVDFVVKALHKNLEHIVNSNPKIDMLQAFRDSYLETDGQVRRNNILQSGSTAVSCVIQMDPKTGKRTCYVANVGDSRAVLCRNGVAERLTIDHRPNLEEEKKRVEAAGGFIGRSNRVNGVLAITRALGDHMLKGGDVVTAVPYVVQRELVNSDNYLILACDGLWDVMTDQEACDFVLEKMTELEKNAEDRNKPERHNVHCEAVAKALVQTALDKKSNDNVTVIIVKL